MSRTPREPLRPMPRRGDGPRRVPGGHRLLRDSDHGPWPWPSEGWLRLLAAADAEEATAGLAYARSGQIATLRIEPGVVVATVQGHAARPYTATVRWAPLPGDTVDRFVTAVAADGAVAGAILLDELPPRVETLLAESGGELRPPDPGDLEVADETIAVHCSCARGAGCRHRVALGWLLQERLAEDPWRLLELRGLLRADLQDRIRLERRSGADAFELGPAADGSPWMEPIGSFWRPGPAIAELDSMPPAHHAPLALLRRLGPSPLEGRFPLVGLLDSALDAIARTGRRLSTMGEEGSDEQVATRAATQTATEKSASTTPDADRPSESSAVPEVPNAPPRARRAVAKRIDRGARDA